MYKYILMAISLLVITSACQPATTKSIDNSNFNEISKMENTPALQFDGLIPQYPLDHQAMFIIEFTGSEYEWEYQLTTSVSDPITEYVFYMEGIDIELNPGAVRVVTDGEESWMIGPGTDELCFRFPNSLNLGPVFLSPDNFFAPDFIEGSLTKIGTDELLDKETDHYAGKAESYNEWSDVSFDLWATNDGLVLQYLGNGMVEDPLYDAGYGFFNFSYKILDIGSQEIEPILGCEIPYPLPDNIQNLIRFPGLISFESEGTSQGLSEFFIVSLEGKAWHLINEKVDLDEKIILGFQKDDQELLIIISDENSHRFVEILNE